MSFFRRYCDAIALTFQAERMPEAIRLKVGGVTSQQMAVYEEFARNIPGFLPLTERDTALFIHKPTVALETHPHPPTPFQPTQNVIAAADDMTAVYEKLAVEVEQFVQTISTQASFSAMNSNLHFLHEYLMHAIRSRDLLLSGMNLVQKVSL